MAACAAVRSASAGTARNTILHNLFFCGIALAGHSPRAVTLGGTPDAPTMTGLAPKVAGVYENVVRGDVADGNGTRGGGGGLLIAAGAPGSAVYRNTLVGNTAKRNGLGGVVLHSHSPGQYFDGNVIVRNTLSDNGIHGGPNGDPGDFDAGIRDSVDITLWSAVTPIRGTRISGNTLSHDHFGIWTQNVPPIPAGANSIASTVAVPVFQK